MIPTNEVLWIGITQLLFQLSRVLSTRHIANGSILATMIMTAIVQVLWLATTALGVKAVLDDNWYSVTTYMVSGLLGSYIAMNIKIKEIQE